MLEEKLKALDRQYAELEARLAAPETYDDPTRVARLNKEDVYKRQAQQRPILTRPCPARADGYSGRLPIWSR